MKIRIKLACLAVPAALLLSGCASDNTVSVEKYNELNGKYDELNGQYEELKTQYEELDGKYNELKTQYGELEKENSELQKKNADIEAKLADSNSIVYNGGGYELRYLGDERDEEGRAVAVLSLNAGYRPYIRIDTKAVKLVAGVIVDGGTYEFANETTDENGYLYIISDESRIAEAGIKEDELPFTAEKYIKLRFIEEDTGQYEMFDRLNYGGYLLNRGFNGDIPISDGAATEDGGIKFYEKGKVLHVLGGAPLVVFSPQKAE